jgi:hypothetical protein
MDNNLQSMNQIVSFEENVQKKLGINDKNKVVLIIHNIDGTITLCSEGIIDIIGFNKDELVSRQQSYDG